MGIFTSFWGLMKNKQHTVTWPSLAVLGVSSCGKEEVTRRSALLRLTLWGMTENQMCLKWIFTRQKSWSILMLSCFADHVANFSPAKWTWTLGRICLPGGVYHCTWYTVQDKHLWLFKLVNIINWTVWQGPMLSPPSTVPVHPQPYSQEQSHPQSIGRSIPPSLVCTVCTWSSRKLAGTWHPHLQCDSGFK